LAVVSYCAGAKEFGQIKGRASDGTGDFCQRIVGLVCMGILYGDRLGAWYVGRSAIVGDGVARAAVNAPHRARQALRVIAKAQAVVHVRRRLLSAEHTVGRMNRGKFARQVNIVQTPAGSRSNLSAKMPPFSSESDAAVSDLNYNAAVVAITVVVGICVSSDSDKSSAVRNELPQAELNR
jgi:hypothetical protein